MIRLAGKWKRVARCKECAKIFPSNVAPTICPRCGSTLFNRFYEPVEVETIIARRTWPGGWEVKGE